MVDKKADLLSDLEEIAKTQDLLLGPPPKKISQNYRQATRTQDELSHHIETRDLDEYFSFLNNNGLIAEEREGNETKKRKKSSEPIKESAVKKPESKFSKNPLTENALKKIIPEDASYSSTGKEHKPKDNTKPQPSGTPPMPLKIAQNTLQEKTVTPEPLQEAEVVTKRPEKEKVKLKKLAMEPKDNFLQNLAEHPAWFIVSIASLTVNAILILMAF